MSSVNRHGLSRTISADVKRTVRQRDGFGCVVCGNAFYTYEHVEPLFADAEAHDPAGITLLCWGHQGASTTGMLSKASIKSAMANPRCHQTGFSFGALNIGPHHPVISVGPVTASETPVVIRIAGDDILKVEPPEEIGGPFRISAVLGNRDGTEVLRIDRNEFATPADNWDVQVVGTKIAIHNAPGDIALELRATPPSGIAVERLDMFHKGAKLKVLPQTGLTVTSPSGIEITTSGTQVHGCQVAFDIGADGSIALGVGGGSVYIDHMVGGSAGPGVGAGAPTSPRPVTPRAQEPFVRAEPKVGRNDPCPCGSGKKYKRCHLEV